VRHPVAGDVAWGRSPRSGDEAGKYRSADWWPGTTQSYEDMDRVALPVMTVTVE